MLQNNFVTATFNVTVFAALPVKMDVRITKKWFITNLKSEILVSAYSNAGGGKEMEQTLLKGPSGGRFMFAGFRIQSA